jgi:hypothetical protein
MSYDFVTILRMEALLILMHWCPTQVNISNTTYMEVEELSKVHGSLVNPKDYGSIIHIDVY